MLVAARHIRCFSLCGIPCVQLPPSPKDMTFCCDRIYSQTVSQEKSTYWDLTLVHELAFWDTPAGFLHTNRKQTEKETMKVSYSQKPQRCLEINFQSGERPL